MKPARRALTLLISVVLLSCQWSAENPSSPARGGRLVVAQSSGPLTFNPLVADDNNTITILDCLHATLVRLNHRTQRPELELAERAEFSPDGRQLTMRLRPGLQFADGHPLTADDVVFTFRVIYDPEIPSSVADILRVGGEPLKVEKLDARTVRFTFPEPYADALSLFDNVPILPRHILEPLYREGQFEAAWGVSTPPAEIVGAGPFRLQSYEPGQRTVVVRNAHYWKRDERGEALPYLEGIDFLIIPDRSTRLLKLQQGEVDLIYPLRPADAQALEAPVERGEVDVIDLGPSLISELLWFNLNPGRHPETGKPYVDPVKRTWFSQAAFRRAIAWAIDREAIIDAVFDGKATALSGFVSPGEVEWCNSKIPVFRHEPQRAAALLDEMGLVDRDGDGIREDAAGHRVRFTLITNAGNRMRERMGLMIQEDLKAVGIDVRFVPVETKTLIGKIMRDFDYEACLLALSTSVGPTSKTNFLMSSGSLHWWYPRQETPATPWEAEIDALMKKQASALDRAERKRLFDRVQEIMSEQVPVIPLVARHLLVAARRSIGNLQPGILYDYVLWNAEQLFIGPRR